MVTMRFATLRAQITLSTSIGLVIGGFLVAAAPNYDSGQAPSLTAEITQIIGSVRKTGEVATITATDGPKQVPQATWHTPVAPTAVQSVPGLERTVAPIVKASLSESASPTAVTRDQVLKPAFDSMAKTIIGLLDGPVGITVGISALLLGVTSATISCTAMPALIGVMLATIVSFAPRIVIELLNPQQSPQEIAAIAQGVSPRDASESNPLPPPPDSTPKR